MILSFLFSMNYSQSDQINRNILTQLIANYQELAIHFYEEREDIKKSYAELVYAPSIGNYELRLARMKRKQCQQKLSFIDYLSPELQVKVIEHLEKLLPVMTYVQKIKGTEAQLWQILKERSIIIN